MDGSVRWNRRTFGSTTILVIGPRMCHAPCRFCVGGRLRVGWLCHRGLLVGCSGAGRAPAVFGRYRKCVALAVSICVAVGRRWSGVDSGAVDLDRVRRNGSSAGIARRSPGPTQGRAADRATDAGRAWVPIRVNRCCGHVRRDCASTTRACGHRHGVGRAVGEA